METRNQERDSRDFEDDMEHRQLLCNRPGGSLTLPQIPTREQRLANNLAEVLTAIEGLHHSERAEVISIAKTASGSVDRMAKEITS